MFIHKHILNGCLLHAKLCWALQIQEKSEWSQPYQGSQLGRGSAWPTLSNPLDCPLGLGAACREKIAKHCFVLPLPKAPSLCPHLFQSIFSAQTQHKLLPEGLAGVRRRNQSIDWSLNTSPWSNLEQPAEISISNSNPTYTSLNSWSQGAFTSTVALGSTFVDEKIEVTCPR